MAGRASAINQFLAAPSASSNDNEAQPERFPPNDGGRAFRDRLLRQYKSGAKTAEAVCSEAWDSKIAGAVGVEDLALDPKSHHQADHLRNAIGARAASSFYRGKVPVWDHSTEERVVVDFPVNLAHEQFAHSYLLDPSSFDITTMPEAERPPTYMRHDVRKKNGDKAWPMGYFSDYVPHTKRDSFLVFYFSNLITGIRYLMCVLRKSDLCRCGCKGFCTLGAVLRIVAWSLNQVALGLHPSYNHLNEPLDPDRFDLRGFELAEGHCGALCEARMDLEECCNAMGFQRWSTLERPCFCCDCTQEDLHNYPERVEASRWHRRDAITYNQDCRRAIMVRIVSTVETLRSLIRELKFDGRTQGFVGLCLMHDFIELNLPRGSRLLEQGPVRDLHDLDHLFSELPVTLAFVNSNGDHGLNFITPIFWIIGFTIDCLCLDVMHIMDLGITQWIEGAVFMRLLLNNFCQSVRTFSELRLKDNLIFVRRLMYKYYQTLPKTRGSMSAIGKLSLKMLGDQQNPRLSAKAAESRNLAPLLVQLCKEYRIYLGLNGNFLEAACTELNQFYIILKSERRNLSSGTVTQLRRHATRFLAFWKRFGGNLTPKHHFFWHLSERADMHGNPRMYWTYLDESENRRMAAVAKSLHGGSTFYTTFLQRVLPDGAGR